MKNKNLLRTIIPLLIVLIVAVGYVTGTSFGTLSAFGLGDISLLCPLGALSSMLAAKLAAPRQLISLAIALILILVFGRAFCAYICPTPVVAKLRDVVSKKKPAKTGELTEEEKSLLKGCKGSCASCAEVSKSTIDSRHLVLLGALLSATIFGFPVFCLICPIGLTFATVLLVVLLFGGGDVTIAVLICPILLALEVVVFRKWCTKICPLSALMSLVAKGNKTFVPTVDVDKCIDCGKCAEVCEQCINPAHPESGAAMNECSKCRACVDACPVNAISMPFLPACKKTAKAEPAEPPQE